LASAAEVLNNAQQPLIFFGGGVQSSNAGEALRALCVKGDIPAVHTLMAAGVLGRGEPHNLGLAGMHGNVSANKAIEEADALLIAGSRLSDRVAGEFTRFAPKAIKIHIDVDAAELGKNVAVDIPLEGDAGVVLEQLLPLIDEKTRPEWRALVEEWQRQDDRPLDDHKITLKPHRIMRAIGELAGEGAIYVTDVGQHQLWAAQYARNLKPRSFLTSGGLGAMGYGYGAAIGAGLVSNGRPVVHITGDGSLHMNMNEACTAVSYNVPVITVIFNNSVLGMVRQWQGVFFEKRYASTSPERRTDFVKVAEGFGLKGFRCANLQEFHDAFSEALSIARSDEPHRRRPCWIECLIDKDEKVLPMQ